VIRIHDTLTNGLRELVPRDAGKVSIYACGPTVYSRIHVGNARPYVVFALLKRFLEHEGFDVTLSRTSPTSTTRSTTRRASAGSVQKSSHVR
jgi:cysteinyl-tRNA synthetase